MTDLTTEYMGLKLRNPLVASASPLTERLDNIYRMADQGASAIVMHSLFEEQIVREGETLDWAMAAGAETYAEAQSYFPDLESYNMGPEAYLSHIRMAKSAVDVPIIGSLNGCSPGGWLKYAKLIEEAGADALELNIYYVPSDPSMTGEQVEQMYLDLVRDVKASISIPLAVKIGPHFSSISNFAKRLDEAGADALVLFNRTYQPDIDLEHLEVVPNLRLSDSLVKRMRLRWTAIIYGHINADIAVTGGIHTGQDALKAVMVGAKVAMMTSAILKHGIDWFATVLEQMQRWMEEHEYESISQMHGSMSHRNVSDPSSFERANYLKMLSSYAPRGPLI